MDISTICNNDGKTVFFTQQGHAYAEQPILTCNKKMLEQIAVLDGAAPTDLPVLVTGESGTNKEKYTEYIHKKSKRRNMPYVRLDCTTTNDSEFNSELFGVHKVKNEKQGIFELASGGTVLLDGISAIPANKQQELLSFINNNVIISKTGEETILADIRFLSISNINMIELIDANKYNGQLYEALSTVKIAIMPLKERPEDIALLAIANVTTANNKYGTDRKLGLEMLHAMLNYNWPGNDQELFEITERLVIMSQDNVLNNLELFENLKAVYHKSTKQESIKDIADGGVLVSDIKTPLKEMVKAYELMVIRHSLKRYKTLRKTAKALHVAPSVLSRKLAAANDIDDK